MLLVQYASDDRKEKSQRDNLIDRVRDRPQDNWKDIGGPTNAKLKEIASDRDKKRKKESVITLTLLIKLRLKMTENDSFIITHHRVFSPNTKGLIIGKSGVAMQAATAFLQVRSASPPQLSTRLVR